MATRRGAAGGRAAFDPREYLRALSSTLAYTPRVLGMVWNTSPKLAAALGAVTVLGALLPAATIWLTKLVIDAVVQAIQDGGADAAVRRVVVLVVVQLGLALMGTALEHSGRALRALLGDRFSNRVNLMILEKAETLDLAYFEDSTFYDMLERARREANMRPVLLVTTTFRLAGDVIQLLSVAALLAALAWWLLAMVAVTSIPYLGADMWFARANHRMQWRRAPDARRLWYLGYVMTSDETVKEVRLFDLGGHLMNQYRRTFDRFFRENRKLTLSRESVTFLLGVISAGTASGLYIFVALATVAGRLTLGDLTLYHQALVRTQDQLRGVFAGVNSMYESNLFLTNLFDFLAFEPEIRPDPGRRAVPRPIREGIELHDVNFAYPGVREPVLRGINLKVNVGETVALVGANGAGKTTIVKLLTRLYDPSAGRVTIDGIDMPEYDVASVRSQIGAIFQDFVRFHATAGDNIGYGNLPLKDTPGLVESAARRSGADEAIEGLPQTYDTTLGRWWGDGTQLSGGEWQKIRLGPRLHAQRAVVDPRRTHLVPGRPLGVRSLPALQGARGRAHGRVDLAPLLHRAHGGPYLRDRGRPGIRARHPRGTGRPRRNLRHLVRHAGVRLPIASPQRAEH